MKEKDKWIKNFRTRMEGYSEPAPADLWEQLEKELDTVPKVIPSELLLYLKPDMPC